MQFSLPKFDIPKPDSTTVTLLYTIDNNTFKIITAMTKEKGKVVLWQGSEYDNIGDWTASDARTKLTQLFPGLTIIV